MHKHNIIDLDRRYKDSIFPPPMQGGIHFVFYRLSKTILVLACHWRNFNTSKRGHTSEKGTYQRKRDRQQQAGIGKTKQVSPVTRATGGCGVDSPSRAGQFYF
ncbi:hypothetical protein ACFL27_21095 [candidate division CSSED10-310 bacterium]|uniref:Uncharacterized protein n=1 Tax=candidate division CSSED10-310 bacterium TaxID=2855610 RepID=A0ABV6Z2S2_UNCC1